MVSEMQHQREATLTTILRTREKQGSPYERIQEKSLPVLQRFGIPIDDARVHENIFEELFQISQICLQTSTMYLTLEDNKRRGFIMVPKPLSLYRMRRNEKRFVWMDNILDALDEKTSRVESATNLLMHIGSLEKYRDVFSEVGEELGLTMIPRLDESTSFAIQRLSNMNYKWMRELLRNLKVVLGNPIFSPAYCIKQIIGEYFVEPAETDTYYFKKERIDWSCKNADDIIVLDRIQ